MSEAEEDEIREAFERHMVKSYTFADSFFARNELRYFDSDMELAWQAFRDGFKFARGEK
jgi:hypothetical protein